MRDEFQHLIMRRVIGVLGAVAAAGFGALIALASATLLAAGAPNTGPAFMATLELLTAACLIFGAAGLMASLFLTVRGRIRAAVLVGLAPALVGVTCFALAASLGP